jgi:hypothetical protein
MRFHAIGFGVPPVIGNKVLSRANASYSFFSSGETIVLAGRCSCAAAFSSCWTEASGALTPEWQFMQTLIAGMPACRLLSAPE